MKLSHHTSTVLARERAKMQNAKVSKDKFRGTGLSQAGTLVPPHVCVGFRPLYLAPPLLGNWKWCNFHGMNPDTASGTYSAETDGARLRKVHRLAVANLSRKRALSSPLSEKENDSSLNAGRSWYSTARSGGKVILHLIMSKDNGGIASYLSAWTKPTSRTTSVVVVSRNGNRVTTKICQHSGNYGFLFLPSFKSMKCGNWCWASSEGTYWKRI